MYIGQLYVIILFIYGSNGVDEKPRVSAELLATKNIQPTKPTTVAPTSTTMNTTTAAPPKTSSETPTKPPPPTNSTSSPTTTPSTPITTNATTPSPIPTNATTVLPPITVPTTPASTPSTHSPITSTISPPTTPTPKHDRSFDAPSFIGGFILSLALVAIIFVSYKFYKSRTGANNYHTL